MKTNIKLILTVLAVVFYANSFAQVGIGINTPDTSAFLHIQDNSGTRGLLIPKTNTSTRTSDLQNMPPATGLLIFDTDLNKFMYWDGTEWLTLTAFKSKGNNNSDIETFSNGKVGIGTAPTGAEKLQVNGNVAVTNNITATNNIETTNGEFIGYGTVPIGGIIMWSGKAGSLPSNWKICDGGTYNGIKTPDLQGRFIVGYDNSDTDYNNPGNLSTGGTTQGETGGEKEHLLTATESGVRAHTHTYSGTVDENGAHTHQYQHVTKVGDGGVNSEGYAIEGPFPYNTTETAGAHTHTYSGTTANPNNSGAPATTPHENRPPYYVLAFIMRVE